MVVLCLRFYYYRLNVVFNLLAIFRNLQLYHFCFTFQVNLRNYALNSYIYKL